MSLYVKYISKIETRKTKLFLSTQEAGINSKQELLIRNSLEDSFLDVAKYAHSKRINNFEIVYSSNNFKGLESLINVVSEYLDEHEMSIGILVFDKSLIEDHLDFYKTKNIFTSTYIGEEKNREFIKLKNAEKILRCRMAVPKELTKCGIVYKAAPIKLKESFVDRLFYYLNKSKKTNVQIYTDGGITRKVFSKIISDKKYKPKKETILCLVIGMELCLDDALDLLNAAGYTLSQSILTDFIVKQHIEENNYNMSQINVELDMYGETILGWKPRED